MKIAIVTQPLLNNYGGVLQNFALQKVLMRMNHEVKTIDFLRMPTPSFVRQLLSWAKSSLYFVFGKKRPFTTYSYKGVRKEFFQNFVEKEIKTTSKVYTYTKKILCDCDVVVVGSDQVWRPKYNCYLKDMFLDFCRKERRLKRVAYAASFGVDFWEYSKSQTKRCAFLARKFDAISVREESGLDLSKKYLGVSASWVLDPVLLLTRMIIAKYVKKFLAIKEKH